MNNIKKLFHIFALTLIAITLTLFTPAVVQTVEQERNIRFGFPVQFVSMNSSYDIVKMNGGPVEYILTNPRQHPMYVIWNNFKISFLILFVPISLLFLLLNQFLKKYRVFEIYLTGFLFLFTIIAFFKFPAEIFIMLLVTTLVTQLLNDYFMQVN